MKKMLAVLTMAMFVVCFAGTHALVAGQVKEGEKGAATGGTPVAGQEKEREGAATGKTPDLQEAREAGTTQKASDIIGKDIKNDRGDDLGKVDDIILINGQAQYLILAHGGLLGIGESLVPVPFQRANVTEDAVVLRGVDKQMLEGGPTIGKDDDYRAMGEPEFEQRTFGYYGEKPARMMRGTEEDRMGQPGSVTINIYTTDMEGMKGMQQQREAPKK